jgi:4-amino-4-deoxy-L-arabinose transferase-like glycosyltransferase
MRISETGAEVHDAGRFQAARSRISGLAAFVAICLVPLVLHGIFLNAPFERDEGVYATIAQGLLDGKLPYRDLFDHKPPLVYFWYAVGFTFFGEDVASPRILSALSLSLTTAALLAQALLVFPRRMAYTGALLFAFSTGIPHVALHANTQPFMMLPLAGSLLFFTIGIRSGNRWWLLAAGAAGTIAIMSKQPAVWNLAALMVMAFWWRWGEKSGPSALAAPAVVLGGAVLMAGLLLLPFVATRTTDDFFYANVAYNFRYVDDVLTAEERLFLVKRAFVFLLFFITAAAPLVFGSIAGLLAALNERKSFWLYLLLAWTAGSALGVAMGTRFYPHYFLQLLPAMAFLTALAVHVRLRDAGLRKMHPALPAAAIALVLISTITVLLLYIDPRGTYRQFSHLVYYQAVWEADSRVVGAWIAERTDEDERIFSYGREAQIYFYADRLPAVRFFTDWAYLYDPGTLGETIEDLRREPPRYIIDTVLPPLFEETDRAPEMERLLADKYRYVGRVKFADIYELREPVVRP